MLNKRYYSHIYVIFISFTSASANCYFANSSEKCQYWLIQFLLALIHSHCSIWLSLTLDTTAYLHIHSLTKKFNKKAWCTLLKPHFHPTYGLYLPFWTNPPPPPHHRHCSSIHNPPPPRKCWFMKRSKFSRCWQMRRYYIYSKYFENKLTTLCLLPDELYKQYS